MSLKVAVVDDNPTTLSWVRQVLEGGGYEVVTYGQSFGILAFIRQAKPSVLILDVNMPALSGNVVCGLLKESPDTKDLVILLFSAMPAAELRVAAQRCGANGFLAKTDDGKKLLGELRMLVGEASPRVAAPSTTRTG